MQTVKPYLIFIGMLMGGCAITAVIAATMYARVVDENFQREQAHLSD